MSLTFSFPEHLVLHVRATEQRELCEAFIRIQEFYESPLPDIRGKHFTRETIERRFTQTSGGLDYMTEWHGFNVPGHVITQFAEVFAHDMTPVEAEIVHRTTGLPRFYVIGSHNSASDDAFDHELAHASYYLSPQYREMVEVIVATFTTQPESIALAMRLKEWLLARGYHPDVLTDEVNAYMATTDEAWWSDPEHLPDVAHELWLKGEPFRQLFKMRTSL